MKRRRSGSKLTNRAQEEGKQLKKGRRRNMNDSSNKNSNSDSFVIFSPLLIVLSSLIPLSSL